MFAAQADVLRDELRAKLIEIFAKFSESISKCKNHVNMDDKLESRIQQFRIRRLKNQIIIFGYRQRSLPFVSLCSAKRKLIWLKWRKNKHACNAALNRHSVHHIISVIRKLLNCSCIDVMPKREKRRKKRI